MDDQNSIGTNTMGVTNATQQILAEAIGTRFDSIKLDESTVTNAITDYTLNIPPQQPKESNANSKNEHDSMSQEEQKEREDEIDVESNGKKKGNQKEEEEKQNPE